MRSVAMRNELDRAELADRPGHCNPHRMRLVAIGVGGKGSGGFCCQAPPDPA